MNNRAQRTTDSSNSREGKAKSSLLATLAVIALFLVSWLVRRKQDAHPEAPTPSSSKQPSPSSKSSSPVSQKSGSAASRSASSESDDGGISDLYRRRESDAWVEATGRVVKILPDDAEGERHQRWLLELSTDITILIAHNIDLAPRVPIKVGDTLRFRGEYEWTDKGGTIHFTHRPRFQRRQPGGWVDHDGTRFE